MSYRNSLLFIYPWCAYMDCSRGEIVEPKADDNDKSAPDGALEAQLTPSMSHGGDDTSLKSKRDDASALSTSSADASLKKERKHETVVLTRKDEFGRDVPVEKRSRKSDRKKKESKKSHKKKNRRTSRSRSPSEPRGRLVGTPPPADPYRPQVRFCVCVVGVFDLAIDIISNVFCVFMAYYRNSSMRIVTNALVMAVVGTIVEEEVRAQVAREAVADGDSTAVATVEATVVAEKEDVVVTVTTVETEVLEADPALRVVRDAELVVTHPTASSGRTTRSRTAVRVLCAKWIRSTRPSQRPGSRELAVSTCQRKTSNERE